MDEHDETEFIASEHDQLISAISKLDKTQHISEPTRNEPTNINSEFNLIKKSNKVELSNVVKVLKDTSRHVKIGQKLKTSQDIKKILPKPLEKPHAERIKRATGYEQTKIKVGRWDPVVARNRTVDFVSFPLKQASNKLQPADEFLSKLKLKSPLEKELEEVDPPVLPEPEEDDDQTYPMSYEEMLEHRQHLAKFRAQQSYKAAKAKRQSKIKSKKYHRILKKEKLKKQLKEFEELQLNNPEEALKKLEELEKARALERHTLRHKNTGKWAKSKLVRAKYDKEVRQQLAEQLSVSRSLTHKTQNIDSSDEEGDDSEIIPDVTLSQDPMNPWMMKSSDKSNIDAEFDFGYKKYIKDKMFKRKMNSDSESDHETNNVIDTDEINERFNLLREGLKKLSTSDDVPDTNSKPTNTSNIQEAKKPNKAKRLKKNKAVRNVTSTTTWLVDQVIQVPEKDKSPKDINSAFEKFQENVANKVQGKLNKLRKQIDKLEKNSKKKNKKPSSKDTKEIDNLEYLKLKKDSKAIIDEELIETNRSALADTLNKERNLIEIVNKPVETKPQNNNNMDIDPNRFIEVKPKFLNTALPSGVNDFDDLDDEQVVPKVDIEEVFEEDDVVASFRQEKEDEMNKDKIEDTELTLPGWGSWGGKGVKAPKRKRNRFICKLPPKEIRRDENKGDIIINEYKDPKLAAHKVSDLPFPFTSVKDYEASIRAPLGNTFIPEKAHKKLIRPSVITKAGEIIEPMDEDELLVRRNKTFNNEAVIKLLAKK